MKKKQVELGIPSDKLIIFENIIEKYFVPGRGSPEGDNQFMIAFSEHLTEKQRFDIWKFWGGCIGSGHDKIRKAFVEEHIDKPLSERLRLYLNTIGKLNNKTLNIELNEDENTITVTFACPECYEKVASGKRNAPFKIYYECCAGGRMYVLEKSLGIKLDYKNIYIPPNEVSTENPCVFTFQIINSYTIFL